MYVFLLTYLFTYMRICILEKLLHLRIFRFVRSSQNYYNE